MIERYELRYFLAVVELGSFSRAAAQMNVTQPTLSTGIAKLEAKLGGPVFVRNSKRVEITSRGAQILQQARAVERSFNTIEQVETAASDRLPIRLGVLTTLPTAFIEALVRRAREVDPDDAVEIIEGSDGDLLSRLERRRIDAALSLVRPGGPRHEVLYREGYGLALWDDHPLAGEALVQPKSLAAEVMLVRRGCEVLRETSRYFTDRGIRPRFSFRTFSEDRAAAMVRARLGVTIAPKSWAVPGVRLVPLAGFDFTRTLGLLFDDVGGPHEQRAILRAARQVMGEMAASPTRPM